MITKNKGTCEFPKKLNLGCGKRFYLDYLNIDSNVVDIIDKECWIMEGVIKSPQDLPNDWFEEVLADMVMEHIHPDLIPNLLYCLHNMIEPGGKLVIIVPNFVALSNMLKVVELQSTDLTFNEMKMIREINNEMLMPFMGNHEGMAHQSIWTPKMAKYWLNAEGFTIDSIEEFGKNKFHLKIIATKLKGNQYASPV